MKLATIDIGSNSIHLLIVEVDADGNFRAIDREREMVRLGEGGLGDGHLTAAATERALAALVRFADLAGAHGCEQIIATATSAVREADNGEKFLRRVRRRTGIAVDMLSGVEEARLISRAVTYVRELGESRTLGIDIGGGSTEFWINRGGENLVLISNRLGSVRLTDGFVHHDPISKKELERLKGFIVATLARTVREVDAVGFDNVIVTSGTSITLAQMANASAAGSDSSALAPPQDTEGFAISAGELRKIARAVTKAPLRERQRIPGLPPERADIIVAGAVLLETIFEELGIQTAQSCDWSLREGVLLNHLESRFGATARSSSEDGLEISEIRRRSLVALVRRYGLDPSHARQTVRLATSIFDQTAGLHRLGREARDLLQSAAFLHDVGYAVSHTLHNRHGQYLITHGELLGFSSRELAMVGNVVRYHGMRGPKRKHIEYGRLRPEDKRTVRRLVAVLTMADALDRSGRAAVKTVEVTTSGGITRFQVTPSRDCHLEAWDARRKAPVFEKTFDTRVEILVSRLVDVAS